MGRGRRTEPSGGGAGLLRPDDEWLLYSIRQEKEAYKGMLQVLRYLTFPARDTDGLSILEKDGARRKLVHLLSNIDESAEGEESDFLNEYRLLLAKELLQANPWLQKLLKDQGSSSAGPERGMASSEDFLRLITSANRTSEDFLKEGKSRGLDISLPGEPFLPGSIVVGESHFLLYRSYQYKSDPSPGMKTIPHLEKGIGGNFFQRASTEEIAKIFLAAKDLEMFFSKNLPQMHDKQSWRNIHDIEDVLENVLGKGESLEAICFARLCSAQLLSKYAAARDAFDEIIPKAKAEIAESSSEKDRADLQEAADQVYLARQMIQDLLGEEIAERANEGRETLRGYREDVNRVSEEFAITFQDFHDAISSLNQSGNINGAAVWSYFSEKWGSEDPEEWRSQMSSGGSDTIWEMRRATRIIYGALAVNRDPALKKLFKSSYDEEEELRLLASLRGVVPDKPLIYVPSPKWLFYEDQASSGNSGIHRLEPARPSFVFIQNVPLREWQREVTVHELIHSGQPKNTTTLSGESPLGEDETETHLGLINEGLTQTLTRVRTDPDFAKNIAASEIPEGQDTSGGYYPYMKTILSIFDKAGVAQSDRENLLEELNAMDADQRIEAFSYLLNQNPDTAGIHPLFLWKDLVKKTPSYGTVPL